MKRKAIWNPKPINLFTYKVPSKKQKKLKKNLTWPQAKIRYPKMNPFRDTDRDGVPNFLDCRPFNKKKDGIASSIKSIATRIAAPVTTVTKAVSAPITKVATKAYTTVDKAVGGILPGGTQPTKKTVAVATTITSTPIVKTLTTPQRIITQGAQEIKKTKSAVVDLKSSVNTFDKVITKVDPAATKKEVAWSYAAPVYGNTIERTVGLIKSAPQILTHKYTSTPNIPKDTYARTQGIKNAPTLAPKYTWTINGYNPQTKSYAPSSTLVISKLKRLIPTTSENFPFYQTNPWANMREYEQVAVVPVTPEIQKAFNIQNRFLTESKKLIDTTEHTFEKVTGKEI